MWGVEELRQATLGKRVGTVLADPPWRFQNKTGKIAPEHSRLRRYETLSVDDIANLAVREVVEDVAHLYLWIPNAMLPDGLKSWKHGDSRTSPTSFGTRSAKTVAPTVAVSVSISAM